MSSISDTIRLSYFRQSCSLDNVVTFLPKTVQSLIILELTYKLVPILLYIHERDDTLLLIN